MKGFLLPLDRVMMWTIQTEYMARSIHKGDDGSLLEQFRYGVGALRDCYLQDA
jgi:hypothetical protein